VAAVDDACTREYSYRCPGAELSYLISDIKISSPIFPESWKIKQKILYLSAVRR